jgi:hypothetical protein
MKLDARKQTPEVRSPPALLVPLPQHDDTTKAMLSHYSTTEYCHCSGVKGSGRRILASLHFTFQPTARPPNDGEADSRGA